VKVTRRLRDQLGTAAREVAQQAKDRTLERLGRDEDPVPVAAPDSPGNRPQTAFAGVLDGRHLWLAVDATPGTLALRTTGDQGQVVPLASDLAEDDPRYRSVRSDLSTLPGPGAARYEVVITAPGGKVHRVWTPPLARNEPVRTPAADGVQWQVARSADGTLELLREPAADGAVLLDIDIDTDDVTTLRIGGAAADAELRLVDDETGEVLVTRPLMHADGVATGTLSPADVPEGIGLTAAVHAGDLPVRRRANDLARPDNAVLLPQVQNDEADGGADGGADDAPLFAVIFRWLPDGILRVRRPKGRPKDGSA
jgi:hypothetical protein